MPATTVRRKAKRVPIRDPWALVIDVFSLVICVFSLFLTVSILFVWQPIGLWLAFFILIGLIVHLARDVFDGRQQLIDVFAGFWRVFDNLRPRGAAGRATGKSADRRLAETSAPGKTAARPARRALKMPATRGQRKAKRVPIRDAWSVAIDVFSLVICVFSLFLTVSVLFVWQPIGLWLAFFILIGLIVHLARDVFDGRQQLIDVFAGFWRVLRSLWPRGVAGRATGKSAGRRLASAHASRRTTAPSARQTKRPVSRRRSASR